jgi:flagellar biogenesis protein FliO
MMLVSAAVGGAAVWVRARRGGLAKLTSSRELRVISSVRVGPKGHLVLAGIGDRAMLLGVTDNSVRRIAWMPAEAIVPAAEIPPSVEASGANTRGRESTAMIAASPFAAGVSAASAAAPAATRSRRTSGNALANKGAFSDILRKLGGRNVNTPPVTEDLSPAATLAELRRDSVQWSRGAANAAANASSSSTGNTAGDSGAAHGASAPFSAGASRGDVSGDPDMEQQAAGILKRRSRGKRA